MDIQRLLFGVMYRFGFTPWDAHELPELLRSLVEGAEALTPGKALDVGCGTGDASIYLAQHGWDVTAIDFVARALDKAKTKTSAAGVSVRYLRGDATKLREYSIGNKFRLVVDNGCLHGLTSEGREAYVREVSSVTAPGGHLVLCGFAEGKRRGPRGFNRLEVEQRFAPGWELLDASVDLAVSNMPDDPISVYVLRRL